jgi:hypothetical protein
MVLIEQLGGAVSRVGSDETAFYHREAPYNFVILSTWASATDSVANMRWTDEFWQAMQAHSAGGVYVNCLGDEGEARIRAAYGPHYERLAALKHKYDPTNFFRHNHNIRPSA